MALSRLSMFYVPIEITEAIIKEVDDLSTLYACSLVCREFLPLAQRRLFHSFTLESGSQGHRSGKYERFLSTLTTTPRLALYVRNLHVEDNVYFDYRQRHKSPSVLAEPILPNLLEMLHNITIFSFECTPGGYWKEFSLPLKQALASFLVRPSIKLLFLRGVHHLPNAFAQCFARIPSITLSRCIGFYGIYEPKDMKMSLDVVPISRNHSIRRFTFSGSLVHTIALQPLVDELSHSCCKLEELVMDFYVNKVGIDLAIELMEKHKNTLTVCKLPHSTFSEDDLLKIDIGTFALLRTIRIFASFDEQDPFSNTRNILNKAHEENRIQEIIIRT
ncbi:hypothetical protein BDQ17DRAFT_369745 [Cyathus striatus]|nr:hypothetical protein BDQ17DRAFT_369745 [Cyathus striatus]